MGVRLDADGTGGIDHIAGTIHYLNPDGSSLVSRKVITLEEARAENLRRTLTEFKRVWARLNLASARRHHLTPYDVLIIASIVEKEAATVRDRPLVASVIYNRLRDHIPWGMDSTTRYEYNDYTKPLTQSQLASRSPYNTRLHAGLPPTPISNPGFSAIEAAAHPARTNYLYFVVKPCGNGASVFESSYRKFLRDSARYQSARARRGGRSPVKC